ncbi:MAG: arylsulfatase, partial [Clostridia bacterium]|nr:arylsulfatase [Clostridia bacterium]
ATLLSLAGIKVPEHFKGFDLTTKASRDAVYIQISESQCARSIRTKDYKYSVAVPTYIAGVALSSSPIYIEDYLYDLKSDPEEKHNLIKDKGYKQVRKKLQKILLREMQNAENRSAIILPAIISKKK